jgi:hypothetical protein
MSELSGFADVVDMTRTERGEAIIVEERGNRSIGILNCGQLDH